MLSIMRIFVYEHITAHGIGREPGSIEHSLFVEGRAMFSAIRDDFAAIAGVDVLTGSPDEFAALAAAADWTFAIAPETDGVLLDLAKEVERVGGRWLGPGSEAIVLTSDKFAMFQHWRTYGVRTPQTVLWPELPPSWPCVVKRRDGAGSEGMRLISSEAEYRSVRSAMIAQSFCPGIPTSVAYICDPPELGRISVALPPTFQMISPDGQFRYGGGLIPIEPELERRAERLGRRALRGVPGLLGYVGVDLLLGDAADGSEDFAIEINPRLTTSYVGLRAHLGGNLAELILEIANGSQGAVRVNARGRVAFSASGNIRVDTASDHWHDPSEFSENRTFFS